jgi:hypothetical protein
MLPVWATLAAILGGFLAAVWTHSRPAAVGLLAIVLGANLYAVAATDASQAFQSTYWTKLPVDNGPLLAALQEERIEHVWLNHWAALPLMVDARAADQPLIAYDWHDVAVGGIDRYPEHRPLMEQARRTAFVLVTDEADPELTQRLRELGVSYLQRRAWPYVVVVPQSRTVHPSEVGAAIDSRY